MTQIEYLVTCASFLYLFPRFNHTGGVRQDVNVLVLVVLVDFGSGLKQGLHEQVQEGRNSDLEPRGGGGKTVGEIANGATRGSSKGGKSPSSSPVPPAAGPCC